MISFRYHLVSLAAALIALAAGVALGAGPLQNSDDDGEGETTANVEISPALAGFEASYAKLGSDYIESRLGNQSVVILTTPTARDGEVKSLIEYIQAAGGEVSGQLGLTAKFLDPANRKFTESVASQSAGSAAGTGEDYERVGSALGRALLADEPGDSDATAQTILSAFLEGGLVEQVQQPEGTASLVLIVTGPRGSTSAGEGVVISQMVGALDSAGAGAVVAGPASAGQDDGVVGTVRESAAAASVSTVDVTDLGSGRIVAVLALESESKGVSGAWGTSSAADGTLPR